MGRASLIWPSFPARNGVTMSRYKAIPLPFYFKIENADFFDHITETLLDSWEKMVPVFNRNGMYLDRKANVCWIETKFGCWKAPFTNQFEEHLQYISSEENILPDKVVGAIKILHDYGMLPKNLRETWWKHRHAVMLRYTYRSSKKFLLRSRSSIG